MDTYSVSDGTAVGNELAREARTSNQFRVSQNAVLVGNVQNHLRNDQSAKTTDTEFKVGMDGYGLAETIGGAAVIRGKGGISGLASQTADKFRRVGNKVSNVASTDPTPEETPSVPAEESPPDVGDFTTSVNADDPLLPTPARPSDITPAASDSDGVATKIKDLGKVGEEGGEAADETEGLAKGLTAATGEGSRFGGLSEAGGVGRFLANRAGLTSELGVEVGGKALGGIGGAISVGQDITQFANTGHIFKKGESGWSEAGNIASMAGAALDMASVAVPILAPLALATNVFSAVASTVGTEQDDTKQISDDSKPPPQQALSVHPAWSAIGMTASVHQPSITG